MHLLEEWRIRDVEQKAERAISRLYELDSLRGDVGGLERADREICALIDGLRHEVNTAIEKITQLEHLHTALIENVVAAEREACARVCETDGNDLAGLYYAGKIRARSEER